MSRNVYVGNLPYRITEEEVRRIFAQDGREVVSVNLIIDRETGRPRGFGFVEMQSEAQAEATVQALDNWMLEGRPLKVNIARPKEGGGGMGPPRRPGPPLQVDRRPPRADYGRPEGDGRGDRPPWGSQGDRPQGDRSGGGYGGPPRPSGSWGDRPQGDRPQGDRPQGWGDRPQGDRPAQWSDRPTGDRPQGDRPSGGYGGAPRPAGNYGDRPQGDRGGYGGPGGAPRPAWGNNSPPGGGGFGGSARGGVGRRRPEPDIDEERARKAIEWERRKGNRKKGRVDDEADVDDTDNE